MLLALKLALVPAFLAALSVAARMWGPAVAGWLAALPVVAGPIVLLLAIERGAAFAAQASVASVAAIAASEAFNLAYAWSCRRAGWPLALLAGLAGWLGAALLLVHLAVGSSAHQAVGLSANQAGGLSANQAGGLSSHPALALLSALALAGAAVALSQLGLPRVSGTPPRARIGRADLLLRMLAGVLLTLAVTAASASLGAAWSGVLSVFPLLGIVLAVSAQCAHGADSVALLARGMVIGRGSFAAFFAVLAMLLPRGGIAWSFVCASLVAIAVQGATRRLLAAKPTTATVERELAATE